MTNLAKVVLGRGKIIRIIAYSFILLSVVSGVQFNLLAKSTDLYIEKLKATSELIISSYGVDLDLICSAAQCKKIRYEDAYYVKRSDGVLYLTSHDKTLDVSSGNWDTTDDLDIVVSLPQTDISVISPMASYFTGTASVFFKTVAAFFAMFSLLYLKGAIASAKTNILQQHKKKEYLESKVQRVLSEFAHHEMVLPVATIIMLSKELQKLTLPCGSNGKDVCEFDKTNRECLKCSNPKNKRITDCVTAEYLNRILSATYQLETVLDQMSAAKQLRYSNGNKSILDLVVGIDKNLKTTRVGLRYKLIVKNESILDSYSLSGGLKNEELITFISSHFNNSIEAKSSKILVEAEVNTDTEMSLYITDNGIGIRDKYNEIVKSKDISELIFQPGVSTKDSSGNNIVHKKLKPFSYSWIKQMLSNPIYFDNSSVRGIGLYVSRDSLMKCGGNLELIDTSERGTTFRLTFLVARKRR